MMGKWSKISCVAQWIVYSVNLKQKTNSSYVLQWSRGKNQGQTEPKEQDQNDFLYFDSTFDSPVTIYQGKDKSIRPKFINFVLFRVGKDKGSKNKIYGKIKINVAVIFGNAEPTKLELEMETGHSIAPVISISILITQGSSPVKFMKNNNPSIKKSSSKVNFEDWDKTDLDIDDFQDEFTPTPILESANITAYDLKANVNDEIVQKRKKHHHQKIKLDSDGGITLNEPGKVPKKEKSPEKPKKRHHHSSRSSSEKENDGAEVALSSKHSEATPDQNSAENPEKKSKKHHHKNKSRSSTDISPEQNEKEIEPKEEQKAKEIEVKENKEEQKDKEIEVKENKEEQKDKEIEIKENKEEQKDKEIEIKENKEEPKDKEIEVKENKEEQKDKEIEIKENKEEQKDKEIEVKENKEEQKDKEIEVKENKEEQKDKEIEIKENEEEQKKINASKPNEIDNKESQENEKSPHRKHSKSKKSKDTITAGEKKHHRKRKSEKEDDENAGENKHQKHKRKHRSQKSDIEDTPVSGHEEDREIPQNQPTLSANESENNQTTVEAEAAPIQDVTPDEILIKSEMASPEIPEVDMTDHSTQANVETDLSQAPIPDSNSENIVKEESPVKTESIPEKEEADEQGDVADHQVVVDEIKKDEIPIKASKREEEDYDDSSDIERIELSPPDLISAIFDTDWYKFIPNFNLNGIILPPLAFPLCCSLIETQILGISSQEKDFNSFCHTLFNKLQSFAPNESLPLVIFLSALLKRMKALDENKSRVFSGHLAALQQLTIAQLLDQSIKKVDILANRLATANFEENQLLNDFQQIVANKIDFKAPGLDAALTSEFLAECDKKLWLKIIRTPLRFNMSNVNRWECFANQLDSALNLKFKLLGEGINTMKALSEIAKNPSLRAQVCPHFPPELLMYLMMNFQPDQFMPEPIDFTHFMKATGAKQGMDRWGCEHLPVNDMAQLTENMDVLPVWNVSFKTTDPRFVFMEDYVQ